MTGFALPAGARPSGLLPLVYGDRRNRMTSRPALALVALMGLSIPAVNALRVEAHQAPLPRDEVARGLALSPVPLRFTRRQRELVGRGSYLVNAQGGCNDCHTNPSYVKGGDPFEGDKEQINAAHYLAGGREFGPVTSRNLTPDKTGKPAGMTEAQFIHTLQTGTPPGQGALLQVMPWPVYGKMRVADLKAVYAFLRAIPPAEPGTTPKP